MSLTGRAYYWKSLSTQSRSSPCRLLALRVMGWTDVLGGIVACDGADPCSWNLPPETVTITDKGCHVTVEVMKCKSH